METSAPKRRKISPTTNVAVSGSDPASGSSDGPRRRSPRLQRPSFVSPTRASLARANPEILERRDAARSRSQASAPQASSDASDGPSRSTRSQRGASANPPASEPDADPNAEEEPQSASQGAARRSLGGMSARPRRSLNKPSPRPLPPPSAQEEELLGPFKGRALRRSPPRGVLPAHQPEEPDLPPTPVEKGMSDPSSINTSPAGIHNSPSRRPRRSRALAEQLRSGSSPLKQPPLRPQDFETVAKAPPPTLAFRPKGPAPTRKGKGKQPLWRDKSRPGKKQDESKGTSNKPHPARRVPEIDQFSEKTALRDSLLAEVAKLEADLEVARRETSNLHQHSSRRRSKSAAPEVQDKESLLEVLRRHALPPEKDPEPDPAQAWLEAALDPMSFLPFGGAPLSIPDPFQPPAEDKEASPPPPVSHHPIAMTVNEERPYLQLFTPLVFTSTMSLLPRNAPDEDQTSSSSSSDALMQKYSISVLSSPLGLFAARVEMLVNTKTLSISELAVPSLDPISAPELRPFIARIIDGAAGINPSALKRNIGVLTWAMAEWTRLASRRARFWRAVGVELGDRRRVLASVQKMRKSRRRGRAGRPAAAAAREEEDDDDDDSDDDGNNRAAAQRNISKAELLPFLGQTSSEVDLSSDGTGDVGVRVEWKIDFDWTGEGKSRIGVLVQVPGKWHHHDNKGIISGIPELFDQLIQGGNEPMDALKTVVALLVGDGKK
ncbi:hypothetical protein BX600DRAFT_442445 [Xylariales sp. PMI_506]|nr:hypothetical protein BX600DRAFT_442445 [Xylariales sp. PMI_506]